MNKQIDIGIRIDLEKLIDTRLLVQAGSGGGKSYVLRKIMETAAGMVQQIVIDPEDEFVTLREKYPFAYVAKDGDIPISVEYAEVIAHKLLETGMSAIISLYELKHHQRILFVARFLNALINAPKELWHSVLVYVDEAHLFCPESAKSESASAVIDLCTRGRKRGFAAILATQRLSKLNKDAAAECLNKLIGRTGQDIDRQRSGDELGMASKTDRLGLRDLNPGEFYAFGPAIGNEVRKVKISKVNTTHLRSGKRMITAPPTPSAIKKILKTIQSIPQEHLKELENKTQLVAEIKRLRLEVGELKSFKTKPPVDHEKVRELNEKVKQQSATITGITKVLEEARKLVKDEGGYMLEAGTRMNRFFDRIKGTVNFDVVSEAKIIPVKHKLLEIDRSKLPKSSFEKSIKEAAESMNKSKGTRPELPEELNLGKAEMAILEFLIQNRYRLLSKVQIGVAVGYSHKGGSFNNAISKLNSMWLIIKDGNKIQVGEDAADKYGTGEVKEYGYETFVQRLGKAEREIFETLEELGQPMTKEDIAQRTPSGYAPTGGSFNNAISKLNSLELIVKKNGMIEINPELLMYKNPRPWESSAKKS